MREYLCPGCGLMSPKKGRCEACKPGQRSPAAHRQVYDSIRWRKRPTGTRWRVLRRDRYTCQRCGFEAASEEELSQLFADHKDGLDVILAEGRDPFDVDECETLCSTCSGTKDGSRRAS